eukprot:15342249-Ditylum_brightwellii.AAC.1
MDRTHSIMRIATTASPVSGADVRERMQMLRLLNKINRSVHIISIAWLKYKEQRKKTEMNKLSNYHSSIQNESDNTTAKVSAAFRIVPYETTTTRKLSTTQPFSTSVPRQIRRRQQPESSVPLSQSSYTPSNTTKSVPSSQAHPTHPSSTAPIGAHSFSPPEHLKNPGPTIISEP